ncbi:MAG: alpha/beta fold hydrolase [Acidimicrobiales bacterium]
MRAPAAIHRSNPTRVRALGVLVALALVATIAGAAHRTSDATAQQGVQPHFVRVHPATNAGLLGNGVSTWQQQVPGIADVRIPSTIDGQMQPALWLPPEQPGPRPLLVALHSWSSRYDQTASIPYARWARANGWAMIHPDFRGISNSPDATGSDLAVQDIVDAIDWAGQQADIDMNNVYTIGFSGGGMMSLLMAGRHPDRISGAVSWVPIYDLVEWYRYSSRFNYITQIEASCGGNPLTSSSARDECRHRSPINHLDGARDGDVPVYLGHGLSDTLVLPQHAVWAFNHLARPEDRLTSAESDAIARWTLPSHLRGSLTAPTYFRGPDPTPLFSRRSDNVTMVLFNGRHSAVFNPGLEWMVHQRAASEPSAPVSGAVTRLYGASFDRDPDAGGQGYWIRSYLRGRSLSSMAEHFTRSSEFANTYGELDDAGFVRQLYRNVFDREADGEGLAYWTNLLDAGHSRGWVMIGFSQSGEMRARTGTE